MRFAKRAASLSDVGERAMARANKDEFRKQINEVWQHAMDQLEEVKEAVLRSGDRVEAEVEQLRMQRDKLLRKLGEQTHKLANQGKLPVPDVVKQTVDHLNEVIDKLVEKSGKKKTKKKATKKAAKKKAKKTAKKTTKKTKRTAR
jgi:sulfite reductase alpha subunit-like flavoprotein